MKSPFWKWLGKQRWRGDNVATLYHCLAAWQPGYGGGPVPTLDHREAWVAYTWVACQGNWDLLDWLETAWSEWLQAAEGKENERGRLVSVSIQGDSESSLGELIP